jgi:hypothetical protein
MVADQWAHGHVIVPHGKGSKKGGLFLRLWGLEPGTHGRWGRGRYHCAAATVLVSNQASDKVCYAPRLTEELTVGTET